MVWEGAPTGVGSSARRLVLHFDVNKTLIMCDPVKGVNCEQMVNSLVSESCWGTWDEIGHSHAVGQKTDRLKLPAAASWSPALREPQIGRPAGLISYAELLEDVLKVTKTTRVHLKTRFTEAGQPGEIFRPHYERLMQSLALPPGIELPHAPDAIGKGRHFIIPSFFELVLALERAGRDFAIVFRTFGVDLPEVAEEWNSFCTGQHPCYPGVRMDGSGSTGVARMLSMPENTGVWYRYGDGGAGAADEVTLSMVDGKTGTVVLVEGAAACAKAIDAKLRGPGSATLGLRDYYPYWAAQDESDAAGKLLLVDTSSDASCHHIFFDDNVEHDRAHIVDCRDGRTGESLPFAFTKGRWLIKAEPLQSIVDPQYFVRMVHQCEAALSPDADETQVGEVVADQADAHRHLQATRMQIVELQRELGLANGPL